MAAFLLTVLMRERTLSDNHLNTNTRKKNYSKGKETRNGVSKVHTEKDNKVSFIPTFFHKRQGNRSMKKG